MKYHSFYKTNNLHKQIHVHVISPLLHVLATDCHLQGCTLVWIMIHYVVLKYTIS